MSDLFEPTLALSAFKLPPQDIALLSFCKSNKPAKVSQWAEQLRLTQIKPSSVALYDALPQIAHLQTDPKSRFDMLECLWSATQHCSQGLSKEYINQPLVLPDNAQKAALLAQALRKHLADGYIVCAKDLVNQKKLKPAHREVLSSALYRAVGAIGQQLLCSHQLYTQPSPGAWSRLHNLYQTAEYYDLHQRFLPCAPAGAPRSIAESYARLLAMDSIQPNQLAQVDITCAYQTLGTWAGQISFHPSATGDDNNIFLVNLAEDRGPASKNRFSGSEFDRVLELDFQSLVNQLSKMSHRHIDLGGMAPSLSVPAEMSATLLEHILDQWSNASHRQTERHTQTIQADACIGLIDCHFHLCGKVVFDQFINPREALPEGDSLLSEGFGSLINTLTSKKDVDTEPKAPKKNIYRLSIQNSSPGGYCLLWQGDLPSRMEAGELIGIREQGRRAWSIGVIRWIRQLKNASQLGIQLITSQPVPYGAAVMYDMGGYSDYMRAIHIPTPTDSSLPASLLTASAPFQEQSRVKLKQEQAQQDVRLKNCVFSTSKVRMFSFETLSSEED